MAIFLDSSEEVQIIEGLDDCLHVEQDSRSTRAHHAALDQIRENVRNSARQSAGTNTDRINRALSVEGRVDVKCKFGGEQETKVTIEGKVSASDKKGNEVDVSAKYDTKTGETEVEVGGTFKSDHRDPSDSPAATNKGRD